MASRPNELTSLLVDIVSKYGTLLLDAASCRRHKFLTSKWSQLGDNLRVNPASSLTGHYAYSSRISGPVVITSALS
jgi:hypothetical protein